MSFGIGEIILVPIPFTDLSSSKVRPAIVIGFPAKGSDLFVVPISSQLQNTDVTLNDWKQGGLNVACGIKGQIATIDSRIIVKTVGRLTAQDKAALNAALRTWLRL
jgi:mRNA interferase MazF